MGPSKIDKVNDYLLFQPEQIIEEMKIQGISSKKNVGTYLFYQFVCQQYKNGIKIISNEIFIDLGIITIGKYMPRDFSIGEYFIKRTYLVISYRWEIIRNETVFSLLTMNTLQNKSKIK